MALPHRNTIRLIGGKEKDKYLIWRHKNGFFTALDDKGELFLWSMINGKILYSNFMPELKNLS